MFVAVIGQWNHMIAQVHAYAALYCKCTCTVLHASERAYTVLLCMRKRQALGTLIHADTS